MSPSSARYPSNISLTKVVVIATLMSALSQQQVLASSADNSSTSSSSDQSECELAWPSLQKAYFHAFERTNDNELISIRFRAYHFLTGCFSLTAELVRKSTTFSVSSSTVVHSSTNSLETTRFSTPDDSVYFTVKIPILELYTICKPYTETSSFLHECRLNINIFDSKQASENNAQRTPLVIYKQFIQVIQRVPFEDEIVSNKNLYLSLNVFFLEQRNFSLRRRTEIIPTTSNEETNTPSQYLTVIENAQKDLVPEYHFRVENAGTKQQSQLIAWNQFYKNDTAVFAQFTKDKLLAVDFPNYPTKHIMQIKIAGNTPYQADKILSILNTESISYLFTQPVLSNNQTLLDFSNFSDSFDQVVKIYLTDQSISITQLVRLIYVEGEYLLIEKLNEKEVKMREAELDQELAEEQNRELIAKSVIGIFLICVVVLSVFTVRTIIKKLKERKQKQSPQFQQASPPINPQAIMSGNFVIDNLQLDEKSPELTSNV